MMRFLFVLTTLVTLACSSRSERAPSSGSAGSAGSSSAPTDAAAASSAPTDATETTLKQHMREHFAAVADLQRAIARGHLDQAKLDARWIVDHPEPKQLAEWAPFVDDMKQAAGDVAAAPDLPSAAAIASRLGRACSRCHEKTNAVVSFAWEEAPADTPALATQMKRHQWAAARLWEGLVGPSDQLWREGANTLATTQLDALGAAGSGAPRGDVSALAKRIRELATTASKTDALDARAALYGELLSTCAGCHALVRPSPVPGP